ncbi:MAG: sensor histidine kinase, partial [Spirochaetales bacterium]|nr:sensor histidine kinase [Spirochaetales bacterium]
MGTHTDYALAAIALGLAIYEIVGWIAKKPRRQDYALASLFLSSAAYAFACARQYAAPDATATIPWLRMQIGSLFLSGIAFAQLFAATTGLIPSRRRVLISVLFGLFALSQFLDLGTLTWRAEDVPALVAKRLFSEPFTFFEAATGPLTDIQTPVGGLYFLYLIGVAYRFRRGDPARGRLLILVPLTVSIAWLVDLGVSYRVLNTGYAMEYAFIVAAVYAAIDRAGRARHAELELREALEEKKTLLRELYHRTKNNLQVVSSMLALHGSELESRRDLEIFRDVGNKITSMAMVHQKLYESKRLSHIEVGPFLRDLAGLMLEGHGATEHIALEVEAAPIELPIEVALPLALATSELLSNSLKHAFPEGRAGRISIEFGKLGTGCRLRVADDGVGLPFGFSIEECGHMGTKTLESIAKHQLRGDLRLEPGPGAKWVLEFDCAAAGAAPA